MRELEGRPYAEIARIMGLTQSALEALIFRARGALAAELEESLSCGEAEAAVSRRLDGRLARREARRLRAHCVSVRPVLGSSTQRDQRKLLKGLSFIPVPASLFLLRGETAAAATGVGAAGAATGSAAGTGIAAALATGVTVKVAAVTAAAAVEAASATASRAPPIRRPRPSARRPPARRGRDSCRRARRAGAPGEAAARSRTRSSRSRHGSDGARPGSRRGREGGSRGQSDPRSRRPACNAYDFDEGRDRPDSRQSADASRQADHADDARPRREQSRPRHANHGATGRSPEPSLTARRTGRRGRVG